MLDFQPEITSKKDSLSKKFKLIFGYKVVRGQPGIDEAPSQRISKKPKMVHMYTEYCIRKET